MDFLANLSGLGLAFAPRQAYNDTLLRTLRAIRPPTPRKGSVFHAKLVFPPSHLVHGVLSCVLSLGVPLARSQHHRARSLGSLPAGRSDPLLQICGHPLFCMVRLDPVHPVLSAVESAPRRLLAALPPPVRGHDHRAGSVCRHPQWAGSPPLPRVRLGLLRPDGAPALRHRHGHQRLPFHPRLQLGDADDGLLPQPHL